MVALKAQRIKNAHIITLAQEQNFYVVYLQNVRVYYSLYYEHAFSVYKKILEINREDMVC